MQQAFNELQCLLLCEKLFNGKTHVPTRGMMQTVLDWLSPMINEVYTPLVMSTANQGPVTFYDLYPDRMVVRDRYDRCDSGDFIYPLQARDDPSHLLVIRGKNFKVGGWGSTITGWKFELKTCIDLLRFSKYHVNNAAYTIIEDGSLLYIHHFGTTSTLSYCSIVSMPKETSSTLIEYAYQMTPRINHACVGISGNRAIVTGGRLINITHSDVVKATCYIMDTVLKRTTIVKPMLNKRERHAMVAIPGNRVFVCGGEQEKDIKIDSEMYDIELDVWTKCAPMLVTRVSPFAVLMPDRRNILVSGGVCTPTYMGSGQPPPEIYNIATDTWRPAPQYMAKADQEQYAVILFYNEKE